MLPYSVITELNNENDHVTKALEKGIYDMFTPNNDGYMTTIKGNSEIGSIYVGNQGRLTVTDNSVIDEIKGVGLVHAKSVINIKGSAKVTMIDVSQYTDSYYPNINISAGATIGTLKITATNKSKITIEDGATIGKIIWNGTEYTSISDFKNAE